MTYLSYLLKEINLEDIINQKLELIDKNKIIDLPGLISENISDKNDKFILSLISKIIEKKEISINIYNNNYDDIELYETSLLFITLGLINKFKYTIFFNLKQNQIQNLVKKGKEYGDFINYLKKNFSEKLNININNIYFINQSIDIDILYNIKDIKKIIKKPFIEGIQLSLDIFNHELDDNNIDLKFQKILGGELYIPPRGWYEYGLNIQNYNYNSKAEYTLGYYTLSSYNLDIKDEILNGIYIINNPTYAEKLSSVIDIQSIKYKILFLLKINPEKIIKNSKLENCWILNQTPAEIFPYKIIIKKIFRSPMSGATQNEIQILKEIPYYFHEILNEKDISFYNTNNTKLDNDSYIIKLYTSDDYIYINGYLREGKIPKNSKYNLDQIKSWIFCLHSYLINQKIRIINLNNNIIYYRGVSKKFPKKLNIGSEFIFPEFISVSRDKNIAVNFACNGTLFIIKLENGIYFKNIEDISFYKNEQETLITSCCTYVVTKIENNNDKDDLDMVYLTCKGYISDK